MGLTMNNNNSIVYRQETIKLPAHPRGFHLITEQISRSISKMPPIEIGLAHLFIQHTSASIAISEHASIEVRADLESHLDRLFPEDLSLYKHIEEGADDMPAHLKNSLLGSELTIPLCNAQLGLGRWQGIFLCEFRNNASERQIIITVHGKCV